LLQVIAGNISISGGKVTYNFTDEHGKPLSIFILTLLSPVPGTILKTWQIPAIFITSSVTTHPTRKTHLQQSNICGLSNLILTPPAYWEFEKTISALNLQHLRDKQVIKLSNGETKRLMIATALLKNPTLLLLDNPLTGLDVATREYFNTLLTEISASGITLVMATSAHEIPDIINNVAVLENGAVSKTLDKQQFLADLESNPEKPNVDAEALCSLIHTNTQPHNYAKIVAMNNVMIRYGKKTILNHINWQINPGERWALLGPNGAGKSTLLSLINGDNPQAYANDIVLFDKKRGSGESIWDIKSKIGFVSPELYQYFPTDNSCLQVIESGFYDTLGLFRQSSPAKADWL
jgi:molybdate transport system ATP-binding protein